MKRSFIFIVAALLIFSIGPGILYPTAHAARAKIPEKVGTPYLGAIAVNADTGKAVIEDNADVSFYPASMVKLMMFLIVQEKIEEGALRLSDPVRVTAESARMGGSQVYLAENEVFPIEDLLYALIIQSANDAAVALAIHVAGSKEAFVDIMQEKAESIGMKDTEFHTVHGLPPYQGQKPDVSSPRDLAMLACELLKHPDILRYTSTQERAFRDGKFEMRSHNRLLRTFDGCDGLKTGYFRAGGFSIAASAQRNGNRFVAVVAGSKTKSDRDNKARELLARAFSSAPSKPSEASSKQSTASSEPAVQLQSEKPHPPAQPAVPHLSKENSKHNPEDPTQKYRPQNMILLILLIVVLAIVFFWLGRMSKRPPPSSRFLHHLKR